MKTIAKTYRLMFKYLRLNLASAMEYRESFIMSALGMALSNSAFIFFWWIAFAQLDAPIGGYDFRDVMFIWAASSSSFGLSNILFGNMNRLSRLIVNGDLDTYLLQPKPVLLNVLCAGSNFSAWGDLLYGIILMCFTNQGALGWVYFFAALIFGSLLTTATAVMFNSLAFRFGDSSMMSGLGLDIVLNLCLYPEGIYQDLVRLVMYTVIPAGFIVHVPLKLARGGAFWWLPLMLIFTAIYCFLAHLFFQSGLKRYESANLIATRL